MLNSFMKTALFVGLVLAHAAHADTAAQTPAPDAVVTLQPECNRPAAHLSDDCTTFRRALMAQTQTCMADAAPSSQGYRARYLLCVAEVNRTFARNGG